MNSQPSAAARFCSKSLALSAATRRQRQLAGLLFAVGVCGLGVRFWLAKNSIGCDDADIWQEHATLLTARGVLFAYEHPELEGFLYNHPPLMGYLSIFALRLAGSDLQQFTWYMKAPGLFCELMSAYLVWRIWSKRSLLSGAWAFAAVGTSLTQILVSGFHCQTDPIYAALTLLAFYLLCEKRAALSAGIALAAALNVKVIPLLLIGPLLSQCRSWREAFRVSLGVSTALIPYLPFLLAAPGAVYRNILAYNSQQLEWGINMFLSYGKEHQLLSHRLGALSRFFVDYGRFLILGAVLAVSSLAAFRSRRFGYHVGALGWALFLVLTPGFGAQYLTCVLPLLFAADYRRAALYSLLAGLSALLIYTFTMPFEWPLHGYVQYHPIPPIAVAFATLSWGVLVSYVFTTTKELAFDAADRLS